MLLILMLMIVFIVIVSATLRYVVRQSHETVDQEQEEQAFNIADSGVSYVLWLLNPEPDGMAKLPGDIVTITQTVRDEADNEIGNFTIDNIVADTSEIKFTSTGKDKVLTDRCQVINVELKQLVADEPYIVTGWDHLVGYPCT